MRYLHTFSFSKQELLKIFFTLIDVCIVCSLCLIFLPRFSLCALFCATLWQPAVFYSVLVPYLRTHITFKPTYVKDCKHYSRNYYCFGNQFLPCHFILVQLTMKKIPLKRNCFKLVESKNYFLHFVFKHATLP